MHPLAEEGKQVKLPKGSRSVRLGICSSRGKGYSQRREIQSRETLPDVPRCQGSECAWRVGDKQTKEKWRERSRKKGAKTED